MRKQRIKRKAPRAKTMAAADHVSHLAARNNPPSQQKNRNRSLQKKENKEEEKEKPSSEKANLSFSSPNGPSDPAPNNNGDAAIQRQVIQKDDKDKKKKKEKLTLPKGKNFEFRGSDIVFRRDWIKKHAENSITDKHVVAPKPMIEMLKAVRSMGYLSWVTDAQIEAKAKFLAINGPIKLPIEKRHNSLWHHVNVFGPPPGEKVLVYQVGDGLRAYYSKKAIKKSTKKSRKGLAKLLVKKLEEKAGKKVLKGEKENLLSNIEGILKSKKGEIDKEDIKPIEAFWLGFSKEDCETIFGKKQWKEYLENPPEEEEGKGKGSKSKGEKEGKGKRPLRKKEPWVRELESKVLKLIKKKKKAEPLAEDIPDIFYIVSYEDKKEWFADGFVTSSPGGSGRVKPVTKGMDPEELLRRIRLKIQSSRVDRELKEAKKEGGKALDLKKEELWAEELRLAVWTKLKKERSKRGRQPELNFPDALGLTAIPEEGDARKFYLIVSVRAETKDEKENKKIEIRRARIGQPLIKGMNPDLIIPVVKAVAFALRRPDKVGEGDSDIDPKIKQKAFPAYIIAKNFRKDFQTVTGGEHEFFMALQYSKWYNPGIATFGEAWQTSYVWWKMYQIPDDLTPPRDSDDKKKKAADSPEKKWLQERDSLQDYFEKRKEKVPELSGLKPVMQNGPYVSHDKNIDIPKTEGNYLIYAKAQIKPTEKRGIEPSHAVYVLKANDGYKLARAETDKRLNEIDRLEQKLKKTKDPFEKKQIEAQLNHLKTQESKAGSVSLYQSTAKSILSMNEKLTALPKIERAVNLQKTKKNKSIQQIIFDLVGEGKFDAYWNLYKEVRDFPSKGDFSKDKFKKIEKTLKKAIEKTKYFRGKIKGYFENDFRKDTVVYNPVATIASEYTGKTHGLTLMLGEARDSTISNVKYYLVDASNPERTEKYEGTGSNKIEAIKAAFEKFAANNDYGNGFMSFRVPGILPTYRVRNKPGPRKIALQILKGVAMVAGIAALAISAVATGGTTLAAAGVVIGVIGGVAGAIVAAENIHNRVQNHRFEYDAEFALDVLAIVGGVASIVGGAGTFVKSAKALQAAGKTGTSTKILASLPGWVQRVDSLEGMLVLHSVADLTGNAVFLPIKVRDDLRKIDAMVGVDPKVKKAMKEQVINQAMVSGFMLVAGGFQTAKGAKEQFEAYRGKAMGKKGSYEQALKDAGILDADGNVIGAPKDLDGGTGAKDADGTTAKDTDGTVPKDTDSTVPKDTTDGKSPSRKPVEPEPVKTPEKAEKKPDTDGGGGNKRPPKEPSTPEGGGDGKPPKEPAKKDWDDPALTEQEHINRYKESVEKPAKEGAELDAWLRKKFREGWRYHPKAKRWRKPFNIKGSYGKIKSSRRARASEQFVDQNRGKLEAGDNKALENLLEIHGNWKDLIVKLGNGSPSDQAIAKQLGKYRDKIVNDIIAPRFGKDKVGTLEGASTKPESDIDLNFYGDKAGENMLAAEAQMKALFGPEWSEKYRMNFYTDAKRLSRAQEVSGSMTDFQKGQMNQEITALTEKFNFAKMLRHAGKSTESKQRVMDLIKGAGLDPTEIQDLARLSKPKMEARRQALHKEIDKLEASYQKATGDDKVKLAQEITKKQMEANLYSVEAYIGPGAAKQLDGAKLNTEDSYQSMLSQWEMIEHVLHEAGGDIVKAMREYEIYKYLNRFSEATGNKQLDLFYDALTKKIAKMDRQAAKSFSEEQIHSLWRDFQNFAFHSLKQKKIAIVIKGGGTPGAITKSWNDPTLTAEEMIAKYRSAGVDKKTPFTEAELRQKYKEGKRFDDETRSWRTPFKKSSGSGASSGSKETSFDDVKGLTPVSEDSKLPVTKLGMDQARTDKFKPYVNDAGAVGRVKGKKNQNQIKGQLAEEVSNQIGKTETTGVKPQLDEGKVAFFNGDQVAGPAPTGKHSGAEKAPLTDGMIAEVAWKGKDKAELFIHKIHEVKSGHGSAQKVADQVEWDIERIKELGLFLKVQKPDGSTDWHFFKPSDIKMHPRSKQKQSVSVFTPTDVIPQTAKGGTQAYTSRDLPGITAEDLHIGSLMILKKQQSGPSEQLELFKDPVQKKAPPIQRQLKPRSSSTYKPYQLKGNGSSSSSTKSNPKPFRLKKEFV